MDVTVVTGPRCWGFFDAQVAKVEWTQLSVST